MLCTRSSQLFGLNSWLNHNPVIKHSNQKFAWRSRGRRNHVGQLTAKEDRAVAMETAQKKLWLDCDCGIDDAIGLLMGLSDPASTLVGSSAVWGNADAKQVATNIGRLLALSDRSDLPVFVGANEPLVRPRKPNPTWFGIDGLGDAPQVRPRPGEVRPSAPQAAAVKLVECAAENDGALTVVALGPLTNIALALKLDPLLPSRLRQLVIMGSGGEAGGVEFNFGCDPEAAGLVFSKFGAAAATGQPSSLVLVGTDCCERHPLPWHIWEGVLQRDTPKARFLQAITEHCVPDTKAKSPQGWALYDLLTVAVALQPGIITSSKQVHVEVENQGSELVAGMAILGSKNRHRCVKLVTGIDTSSFYSMCMRCLD